MRVAILGPVEARDGDRTIEASGGRLRRLLARLAAEPGRSVSTDELFEAVWAADLPADPAGALHSLVSRLRRTLGDPAVVEQTVSGYRLAVAPTDVDAFRFTELARDGRQALRAGDAATAAGVLREALALWRGPALVDAGESAFATGTAARLESERLDALVDRIDADLALERGAELLGELTELAAEHPVDERLSARLMDALVAAGRPSGALAAYERLRVGLADRLGSDPSADLQARHLGLLRGEAVTGVPDGAAEAAGRGRTNLRAALTSFVGREEETKRLVELLESRRLTTIVGPGGAGKTRLAVEVARGWVDRLPGGAWFVGLAPVTDERDVAPAILDALGLRERNLLDRPSDREPREAMGRLLGALRDAPALLILDNCEHLIGRVAQVANELLLDCPDLRVLATSREPLGIDGESLCAVSSLPLPPEAAVAEQALAYPSVRLFVDRAAAVDADFALDEATVPAVIQIVRRLDGLPLALELAAARLRTLPVDQIERRLSDRFRLLSGGSRTAMPRHRTLRAVVEWSWDLLSGDERLLVERLSVFPAGATLEAAATVCGRDGLSADGIPELLDALVDKSLLVSGGDRDLRYTMLETIREYGLERLAERGEAEAARRAHAGYFAELVAQAEPLLRTRDQVVWLARLRDERENVLAALRFLGDGGDAQGALELAVSLAWWLGMLAGADADAASWLGYALSLPVEADSEVRALAEASLAMVSVAGATREAGGDLEEWRTRMKRFEDRLEDVDPGRRPMVAIVRPALAFMHGDMEAGNRYVEGALSSPDPWIRGTVLMIRAYMSENDGKIPQMRVDLGAAMAEFSEVGDRFGLAITLAAQAQLMALDGDLRESARTYEQALGYLSELGSPADAMQLHLRLADVLTRLGDVEGARRHAEALGRGRTSGDRTFSLVARAGIAQAEGDRVGAGRLREEMLAELERLEPGHPLQGHERAILQAVIASDQLRDGLVREAGEHLAGAYVDALGTRDMPVIAAVGVAAAELAAEVGRPEEAAGMLGAAAALRGADDRTSQVVERVTGRLRAALGERFDELYARGKALDREAAIARLDPRSVDPATPPPDP